MDRHPLILIAENIRSLYNVGSLFRTCDGALVEKLCLCGYTGHPPRKEIDKTSLGSVDSVPWEHHDSARDLVDGYRRQGIRVLALERTGQSVSYTEIDYTFPLALVLGNEVTGIEAATLDACDGVIHLPMYGMKESLNVAVAAGIVAYHVVARFHEKKVAN